VTPLIREMVAFTGSIDDSPLKPEEMMWFDAGRLSPTEAIRVPANLMMNLPFPKTAIATIDTKGVKVVAVGSRKKPLLHWVASHMRKNAHKQWDVKEHLRGVHEFRMDGFHVKLEAAA